MASPTRGWSPPEFSRSWHVLRFLKLGAVVGAVAAFAFGPFVAAGQLEQVFRRLFPWGRGLLHAYWCPNVWALYAAADKAVTMLLLRVAPEMVGGAVDRS